jgi:hypothetical protein
VNRFAMFGFLFGFLLFASWIATAMGLGVPVDVADGLTSDGGANLVTVGNIFRTFFKIISFQIEDIPAIISIIFISIGAIVLYMIIDIVKDLIPFT